MFLGILYFATLDLFISVVVLSEAERSPAKQICVSIEGQDSPRHKEGRNCLTCSDHRVYCIGGHATLVVFVPSHLDIALIAPFCTPARETHYLQHLVCE